MTLRLPTPTPRSFTRVAPGYGPWSIPGLVERWPISEGEQFQDSLKTTAAGTDDPVGAVRGMVSGLDMLQATTSKKPTLDASGPALRYDLVDDILRVEYGLSMSSKWAIAMAVWARDDTDKFILGSMGVTNLDAAGEKGVLIEPGDSLQRVAPSNWNPDSWCVPIFGRPNWSSGDGVRHQLLNIYLDANNLVELEKTAGGDLSLLVRTASGDATATLTVAFSAGDAVFVAAQWDGVTATLHAGTAGGGALATDTGTGAGAFAAGSYTFHIGSSQGGTFQFDGYLNVLITNDGSSAAAITDRFNAGNGRALVGNWNWLARHTEELVLHVGGDAAGTALQMDSVAGATDLLAGASEGRYDFTSDIAQKITLAQPTELDAATKASFCFDWEPDTLGADNPMWCGGATFPSEPLMITVDGGKVIVYFGSGSNFIHSTSAVFGAGERRQVAVAIDLGLSGTARVKLWTRLWSASSQTYGAWTEITDKTEVGTIPASIAASSDAAFVGGDAGMDGRLDDLRWVAGLAHDPTAVDASYFEISAAPPYAWAHWYPFDGDATDVLGGHNGTVAGSPAQVADQRHHLGRFERYDRIGKLYNPATGTFTIGSYRGLDGQSAFTSSFWIRKTEKASDSALLFTGSGGVWIRAIGSALYVYVDGTTKGLWWSTFWDAAGRIDADLKVTVVFDGSQAEADRVKVYVSEFDPETGLWGADADVGAGSLLGGGCPTTTGTSTGTSSMGFIGMRDRMAVKSGASDNLATIQAHTIYVDQAASHDLYYDHGSTASTNRGTAGSSYNGVPGGSGAIGWHDGRVPSGWTLSSPAEYQRATGANQVTAGRYGLRVKSPSGSKTALSKTTVTVTAGRLLVLLGNARETDADITLRIYGLAVAFSVSDAQVATSSSMGEAGVATRATATNTALINVQIFGTNDEGYVDDLRAYELAVLTPSVATKGVPSRVIWSASKDGAGLPYVYAAVATDEKLEVGVLSDTGSRAEDSSAGSVSTGAHSLIVEHDGAGVVRAYVDATLVATVNASVNLTGMDRLNFGGLVGYLEGHPFDERIGDAWLHAGSSFPGYTAIDRTRLHNYLAARTTGLSAL